MEEALKQLVTDTLDFSKRKFVGQSGEITVTMDTRALAPDHRIFYRNLHKFRVLQMNEGVDLSGLSDEQWGMVQLDKCHHISTTSTSKDGPQSYRVRICKTCCQEDSHIELGTYVDQESAILVNDTFEILNERLDRLIVLRIEDKPDLHHLVAKKYDRSKGRDYACILDLISERISAIEGKKRKPNVTTDMISTYTKRNNETGSVVSSENFPCSTSSETSDELLATSTSRHSINKTSSSILTNNRLNSGRKPSRKLSFDADIASNSSSSSSIIDDDITVTEDNNNIALRELSSICYQRLISPSITGTIPDSANLSPGMMTSGTSLFHNGIATTTTTSCTTTMDLARSLELVRSASMNNLPPLSSTTTISSLPMSTSSTHSTSTTNGLNNISQITVAEGINIDSPYSNNSATTTLLIAAAAESSSPSTPAIPSPQPISPMHQLPSTREHSPILPTSSTTNTTVTNSTNKRVRSDESVDLSPTTNTINNTTTNINNTTTSTTYQDRLNSSSYLDGQTPRKRAATFSVSEPYAYYNTNIGNTAHNPIATLTWLASMEECEVDVARSLFELRGNKEEASSLFDRNYSQNSTGGRDPLSLALGLGSGSAIGSSAYMNTHSMMECEEGEYYDENEDEEEEYSEEDEELQPQQDGYYNLRRTKINNTISSSNNNNRNFTNSASKLIMNSQQMYGNTVSYQHTGQLFHQSASSHIHNLGQNVSFNGTGGIGQTRMRSSSMSMMDRGEAAWAILGNTGGYRSKMDPLSMALKKYHERGGSANAAASGFVGIYSPEDRKQRILRFLEKRKRRMWTKKVKYDVRKNFADSRVRVKGRFVKKQDEEAAAAFDRHNTSMNSLHSSCGSYDHQEEDDQMREEDVVESGYDHTDVDLELLDQLNAQQQVIVADRASTPSPYTLSTEVNTSSGNSNNNNTNLSLKLKITKPTPTTQSSVQGSGSGRRRERSNSMSKDAKVAELKLALSHAVTSTGTTSSSTGRRRRNSRVEDPDLTTATSTIEHTSSSTAGSRRNSISVSPSSAMTLKLERAHLNSAVKPPPPAAAE